MRKIVKISVALLGLFLLFSVVSFVSFTAQHSKPIDYSQPLTVDGLLWEIGSPDPSITTAEVDGGNVYINYHKGDLLGWKDLSSIQQYAAMIFDDVRKDPRIDSTTFSAYANGGDQYGGKSEVLAVRYTLSRASASRIKWDSFLDIKQHIDEIADTVYVHPELK